MRKFRLTLSAEHINFTDVLLGNCGSYIVQIPLATIYISMVFLVAILPFNGILACGLHHMKSQSDYIE